MIKRRQFLKYSVAVSTGLLLPEAAFSSTKPIRKLIPKTGELLPVIGMGTSRTFDAINDEELMARLSEVMNHFFEFGGGMIDSSPMYGSSQEVIGRLLKTVKRSSPLFSATKVWTEGRQAGLKQMEASRQKWSIERFDLMQIHNLVDWRTHFETLKQMKAKGDIRYIGITTSHGRYHQQLAQILAEEDFDFVQLSYNIANHDVESELLPIALEKGIAVIVNRPYQRGALFRHVKGKSVPPWAGEYGCNSWGQFFLKYAVSHPAVTCVIPATTKVKHLEDNMLAGRGQLPDVKQRIRMRRYFEAI